MYMDELSAISILWSSVEEDDRRYIAATEYLESEGIPKLDEFDEDELDELGSAAQRFGDFLNDQEGWTEGREHEPAYRFWCRLAGIEPDMSGWAEKHTAVGIDPTVMHDPPKDPSTDPGSVEPDSTDTQDPPKDPSTDPGSVEPDSTDCDVDSFHLTGEHRDSRIRDRATEARRAELHREKVKDLRDRRAERVEKRDQRRQRDEADALRKAELHKLRVEKLEEELVTRGLRQRDEKPMGGSLPQGLMGVLGHPKYLEVAAEILFHRKRQLHLKTPAKRLEAMRSLLEVRRRVDEGFHRDRAREINLVWRHLRFMLECIRRGDDMKKPNFFVGNFITGSWEPDE